MKKKDELLFRLGEVVRARRKARGVSQEELAHASGLHATYIGSLERGEVNISVLRLANVARALDCGLSDLLPAGRSRDANKFLAGLFALLETKDDKFLGMLLKVLRALDDSRG